MAPNLQASQFGVVSRGLPQPSSDTIEREMRLSRYGGQMVESVIPTKHVLSDEGSYFAVTNPTPGTAIAGALSASFSDTIPWFLLNNIDQPGNPNSKRVYIDYLKLIVTVAPATATTVNVAAKTDTLRAITTNNFTSFAPQNVNRDSAVGSISTFLGQSSATASAVAASTSGARLVQRSMIAGVIPIVNDVFVWKYGGEDMAAVQGLTAARASMPARWVDHAAPVIIGPQQTLSVYLWFPGNATTALSYEFEAGWWER